MGNRITRPHVTAKYVAVISQTTKYPWVLVIIRRVALSF